MSARRSRRPARAELVACGLVFVALQGGLYAFVGRTPEPPRDPEFARKQTLLRDKLAERPGDPLCLVLGSSRASMGLRPDVLSVPATVFNFGQTACGPARQHATLRKLAAEGVRPRWVVAEIPPSLLAVDSADDSGPAGDGEKSDLFPAAADAVQAVTDWARPRMVPAFAYRHTLLRYTLPKWNAAGDGPDGADTDPNGWLRVGRLEDPDCAKRWVEAQQKQHGAYLAGGKVTRRNAEAVRRLLAGTAGRGTPTLVALFPEGPSFRPLYPPGFWEECVAFLESACRESGATLVNAREWMPEDAFSDGHHLLPEPAAAFTRRFGAEALGPFLSR